MSDYRLAIDEVQDAPPHDHAVHVYADDFAISQELMRFVRDGVVLGESVIVVATSQHREPLARWRDTHLSAADAESLLLFDAADTLEKFMVAGSPDPPLFEATVGPVVDRAAQGGRAVRAFGEMVALLWADGNLTGALALESLWNDMAQQRQFFLSCGYPAMSLDQAPIWAVNAICERHSEVALLGKHRFADTTAATPQQVQRMLLPIPTSVSAARHVAIRVLAEWELPHLIGNAAIITSELAANAVLHADSAFRLTLSRDATCLRIDVEDGVPSRLATNRWPVEFIRSGLASVESVASGWGCEVTPDGKTVWAELAI
jgi:DcmR-like sensory protein